MDVGVYSQGFSNWCLQTPKRIIRCIKNFGTTRNFTYTIKAIILAGEGHTEHGQR